MIYDKNDVKRMFDEVIRRFTNQLSDPDDSGRIYVKMLKQAVVEVEDKL